MNAVCSPFKNYKSSPFWTAFFIALKCRVCDFFRTFRFSRFLDVSFSKSSTFRFAGFTYTIDLNSHVSYYHDRYDLEADIVLHLEDGRYALIECKLGSREIDDGSKHLLELKRLIQEHNTTEKQMPIREPDLLIVMTGGSMAYTRQDGVKVIPLACLKD